MNERPAKTMEIAEEKLVDLALLDDKTKANFLLLGQEIRQTAFTNNCVLFIRELWAEK